MKKIMLGLLAVLLLAFGELTLVGGLPHPAAWALVILGFGALGASLRHHRQRSSSRFA